jgi:hypothetical protein
MNKVGILLLVLGVVSAIIWQIDPQFQDSSVTPPVTSGSSQTVLPTSSHEKNEKIIPGIPSTTDTAIEAPAPLAEDHYAPEIEHNPIVPVEPVYVPLSQEEKAFYTKKREQAEQDIQQAMVEYNKHLDDPVKRAEIQASIQANREEYKQAMIKLAREIIQEQSKQDDLTR